MLVQNAQNKCEKYVKKISFKQIDKKLKSC